MSGEFWPLELETERTPLGRQMLKSGRLLALDAMRRLCGRWGRHADRRRKRGNSEANVGWVR